MRLRVFLRFAALLAPFVLGCGDDSAHAPEGSGGAGTPASTGGAGAVGSTGGVGAAGSTGGVGAVGSTGGAGAGGSTGGVGAGGSTGGAGAGGSGGASGTGGAAPRKCERALVAADKCPVCASDATCDAPTYTDNGDGTVSSSCCGLVWQQHVDPNPDLVTPFPWAAKACSDLVLAGGGWRLPTKDELLTLLVLVGPEPFIDKTVFPDTPAFDFWSSTPGLDSPEAYTWTVAFERPGYSSPTGVDISCYVRCVR